ncbi:polysaccharide pyruvyl transferase family protein [Stutzerimonas stutzeri]|uniref:polysaccharide pyruvyl transferase family protein n=1 Tax=Stutzerimonas stutzeri TaxID=316 RepID=UPI001783644D|nr:polysaccharide pyruvyl transferase family protein [Stutzerimonas stutzeri]MBD9411580.1 radical SAM protein [Stutzerimonas stutzeri]
MANVKAIGKVFYELLMPRPLKLSKPTVIQFPVIDICNSKCQMCRIWENKKSEDITAEQLRKGLSNGLFSDVTGIGFNGGEPTLRKDLPDLVKVVIDCLPKLETISLITNAYNYKDIISQIGKVGELAKASGKHFDLMVSLDGYKSVHDRVRGKEGNFERAQHVIKYAKESPLVDNLRIGCTVIRDNVFHLPDLLDYCIENDLYIKYRQGVPHQRLYTESMVEPYALSFDEKYEFVEFLEGLIKNYEPSYLQRHFYRSLINQVIHNSPRGAGCDWQHRGATITAKGELAYCAIKSKPLMKNISDGDPERAYFSNEDHLKDIRSRECDDCHHDYVGIPSRGDYFKFLLFAVDKRIGLKSKISSVPGFSLVHRIRAKRAFAQKYKKYSELPASIRLSAMANNCNDRKVMICGWYGTETLGDKAIVAGIISTVKAIFDNQVLITVVSLHPYITEMTRMQMPEFENVNVVSLEDATKMVANQDFLLFGGGPVMAINELAPMQVLFERAKRSGVKTVASAIGVGPLGYPWLNKSIFNVLKLCDFRIYRDEKSLRMASQLGVSILDDVVAEDPAFTWLKGFVTDENTSQAANRDEKILLLGLRDFPYREYAPDLKRNEAIKLKESYENSVVHALEALVDSGIPWKIRPLPMCTNHFGDDDRWFYRRLFRSNEKLRPYLDYSLLGRELRPSEYVEAFKSADVLLGMRFHSIVFGLGLGTKTVAIDYTMGKGKVKSLSDKFGIEALSMYDLNPACIQASIMRAFESKNGQKIDICHKLAFASALKKALLPEEA